MICSKTEGKKTTGGHVATNLYNNLLALSGGFVSKFQCIYLNPY